jgi:EAL domain-containing protein (putative c-di-GMP-specific phosphodiesterase class I)
LARCSHPVRGLLALYHFIPLAVRTGLIEELTGVILAQAMAATTAWSKNLAIAVNVHPHQLQERTLPERLYALTQRHGFSPSRLIIEVTESAKLENFDVVRTNIEELKALGIRFALGDFGTGYSSFRCLHELPFDELKIDAGFVQSVVQDRKSRTINTAIIELGHRLRLSTTAEGIEHRAQFEVLRDLGCNVGQGWYFGKPLPEDRVMTAWPETGDIEAQIGSQIGAQHLQ